MNPYPLSALNHFTVPVAIKKHLLHCSGTGRGGAVRASGTRSVMIPAYQRSGVRVAVLRAEDREPSSRERARREREGDAGERSGARARDEQQSGREREVDCDVPADAEREQN